MDPAGVRERANDVPREPGVYMFRGEDVVLYIGKALDLRDRVRSYADPRSARIRQMVAKADDVEVAVTDTETQALLLEANLIKRHQPRYNVRLKDDKSYPLVQLTDHEFPRIQVTRDPAEGAVVYGPYTDKGRVDTVVKALREIYGVRGCSDHKFSGRERPCLDYDIGLCTAPCTGEIDAPSYVSDVESVKRFFEGETGVLADPIRRHMDQASQARNFERAANLRDRLDAVEAFHGGGGEAIHDEIDRHERAIDVLGVAVEGDSAIVARLHSTDGQLVDRTQHSLAAPDAEDRVAAILAAFIPQYYAERELPDAILLPENPGDSDLKAWLDAEGVAMRVPGAGRESKLVDLALKNAHRRIGQGDELAALADTLNIPRPARIEGFDVSHAHGKSVVGSNVCFVDGSPDKAAYRRKKLDEENDDYANMKRLIEWRALRAVEGRDDRPDPDLLVIDGGRGQLDAAIAARDKVGWDIPAIGLAKREEVVVTAEQSYNWPQDAPQLHLIQRVRDEAHRFAVQYHQTIRDDITTVLDDVPGVGPELRKRLLRRFGSVENMRAASPDELQEVPGVGAKTAETIEGRL